MNIQHNNWITFTMEAMLERQRQIIASVERIITNFKKDSPSRKTVDYLKTRLETLQNLWDEFDSNNTLLQQEKDKSDQYFTNNHYEHLKQYCNTGHELIRKTKPWVNTADDGSNITEATDSDPRAAASGTKQETKNMGSSSKTDELLSQQKTNCRALSRAVSNIDVAILSEKWEIEDKLQIIQARWKAVDTLHWQIDNLLEGKDEKYEKTFSTHEAIYEKIKGELHRKLGNVKHQQDSMPHIELPTFSGNYTNWPTFSDLYCEAIHKNPTLSKSQKMQHLKGKLKGEAEKLVQHLTISSENYDTCWEILNRRYNNIQLLFTKQMQTFMNQPPMQKYNAFEIKRLHDISFETVQAIHNLGVDTSTWDPILVHIMTEKMDPETYTAYMDARENKRDLPSFDELITILENKFTALEPLMKRGKQAKQNAVPAKENEPKQKDNTGETRFKFAKTYKTYDERVCPLCKTSDHVLLTCRKFLNMTPDAKVNTIKSLGLCKNCLFYHKYSCTSTKTCKVCNNKHHTILHEVLCDTKNESSSDSNAPKPAFPTPSTSTRKSNHVGDNYGEVLLATVELKVRARDGTFMNMRCLLDQGSQINLITESAAQRLELERCNQNSSVFGVGTSAAQSNGAVQLICESRYNNYAFITDALVMPKLIGQLPNYTFEKQNWPHINNINLADPEYNISRPVDILLDAKVYAEILMDGILRGPATAPIAQQTQLGWILVGNVKTFNCHAVLNNLEEISQYWELEEITQHDTNLTPADKYCETLYQATTTRRPEDGRYEVRLPMKPNYEQHLAPSKMQAVAQFQQLEKRFARDADLSKTYKQFIAEYKQLEHMKLCTIPREPSCFLPHHGVVKRLDTEIIKLRTVFNASSKLRTGYTLNELMERGPNLQQDLQRMILQWRTYKYVYTADVEKFYRQILVKEEDQHLQKIVWRDSPSDKIEDYQLCTVTYGTKAAPYLAMRTIKQLAQDDGHKYPLAINNLNNQLYVDDLLGGNNNIIEAKEAQKQTNDILRGGGFTLRKWASNDARLLEHLSEDVISQNMLDFKHAETNKTLGLSWNPRDDQFTFASAFPTCDKADETTKRTLLSNISKTFDPLGWLSPITIKGKLIFQKVWTLNLQWDDRLPRDVQHEWNILVQDLRNITEIKISRWMGDTNKPIELHGFCDASEKAYGCVIFCKSLDNDENPVVQLVAGKTKLSPLNKPKSLPRLELCGALLLSRLMKKVIESTNIQTRTRVQIHGWTDSMVVLGWLQGDTGRWKTFVANRVKDIKEIMPSSCWKHVKSDENPADCASRGLLPSQLLSHRLWWEGPEWLKHNDIQQQTVTNIPIPKEEIKLKVCVTNDSSETPFILSLLEHHSSMERVTRILAWVSRFIYNIRRKDNRRTSYLNTGELKNAHDSIIRAVQNKHYELDIMQLKSNKKIHGKSQLLNLNPYIDDDGILRVGGRLGNSNLDNNRKHPIILPNKDHLSILLINGAHRSTLHGGARQTLTYLRTKYWILGGMSVVKRELRKCIRCLRFKGATKNQLMADLPNPRVTPSRPFTHTGVDLAGPVEVKSNRGRGIATSKGYVTIFVCLATKAIHLELVSDLSSTTFLAAFKRLCSRRGTPRHMYSDCGTNFVGAARSLQQEHQKALEHYLSSSELMDDLTKSGVDWHFNAPSWPTGGGLWEAAVRRMKHHLKRVLGEQKLTYEEFTTLLTQIEACLNSRPLVALSDSIEDLECLTPGHFLTGDQTLAPPISQEVEDINLGTRWKLTEKMHKDFWRQWSAEYLQTLQTRSKWHYAGKDLQVGDLVIIKEDNIPPARWLLGRIVMTHPGNDGRVRVVTLKTKNKDSVKRPLNKLIRLPIETNSLPPQTQEQRKQKSKTLTTTSKTTKPNILFNFILMLLTVLCMTTTAIGAQQQAFTKELTTLNPNLPLYFDKIANMRIIQDEWRMVVFYNLSTYWHSLANIQFQVDRLNELNKEEPAFKTITAQLQHEIMELQHNNIMLKAEHGRRTKRGLINGIGYVANSLFGVLDQRDANKYDEYIRTIQDNENNLNELYKQHTSIIQSQFNIVKRNEEIMIKQFGSITQQMSELYSLRQEEHKKSMYVTAAILTANLIINNLRRLQEELLDQVTEVRSGRMDTHLLKPEEFEHQLNIITANIPDDVTLPCVSSRQDCVREMYKLSRVHVRLNDFLIFEVKLPLIHNEPFELNRVIPIPRVKQQTSTYIKPTAKYSALNLKRDMIIPISEDEIHAGCISFKESDLLCRLDLPIHTITREFSALCEAQIINNKNLSTCGTVSSRCRDDWIMLHSRDEWLYSCCQECYVRIFCKDAAVTTKTLRGTGIVKIWPGCMLRGENIMIHSPKMYHSEITINDQENYLPESGVNNILKEMNFTFTPESHVNEFKTLQSQINSVKMSQENMHKLNLSHDAHHYSVYGVVGLAIIVVCIYGFCKIRKRRQRNQDTILNTRQDVELQSIRIPITEEPKPAERRLERHSTRRVNKQTSP